MARFVDAYYVVKPLLPRAMQVEFRRLLAARVSRRAANGWPILEAAAAPPEPWHGWPDGKRFALVLTHDVESAVGHDRVPRLMQLEETLGFRSSFNLVPERYAVSAALRDSLTRHGFEVGVHGLKHDGHLFFSRKVFERRARRINAYLREWGAVGFRAPSMRRDLSAIARLDLEYDSSTFDTDPFEPHPEAAGTIFPFMVRDSDGNNLYAELPYTLPQDFTLFVLLRQHDITVWLRKLAWIAEHGGMALVNAHPDYMCTGEGGCGRPIYPQALYQRFLEHVRDRYAGQYWQPLPREMARFWVKQQGRSEPAFGGRAPADPPIHIVPRPEPPTIWIDLDNTPHVPFFKPIIAELERRGFRTMVTARDAFQVCALAERMGVSCRRVGRHHGKHRVLKLLGLIYRAGQLLPLARQARPALAVSHGSRSQVLAANMLGIPSVVIADYEYSKTLFFMRPKWEILTAAIPADCTHWSTHVLRYSGIKEDVYVGGFHPDAALRDELGLVDGNIVVTVRPPATEAHYHNPESELLFAGCMDRLCAESNLQVVLLPRNEAQTAWIRARWPRWFDDDRVRIPEQALDGLNLLWHSDLAISGGGTMNREAAALGIPVYSIFRGRIGAVDRELAGEGRLVLLTNLDDVRDKLVIRKRAELAPPDTRPRPALEQIVAHLEHILHG